MIAGIDYSTTSPSICVWKNGVFTPNNCTFSFFALDKWRDGWSSLENVNCFKFPKELEGLERYSFLAEWTIEQLRWDDGRVEKIVLEDYSYGSVGRVFHIAENVGILKHILLKQHFTYETIAPTTLKKFATGRGNASKDEMLDAWKQESKRFDLIQETGNPASDIIDSFYLCKYGFNQLQ